ncbi:MAG TPA: hypothetical protein VJQ54_00560 [Candidatus Sulfotelmatobacter sp.]|nr:hypothetical protein [Candidatus Sulfotelmatobacter sp.]
MTNGSLFPTGVHIEAEMRDGSEPMPKLTGAILLTPVRVQDL